MTNPTPTPRNQLSSQPTGHPISYGPWLLLIVLLLVFSLFGPLNFLLNQLNSSNYTGGLLNRTTFSDWILYTSIIFLMPIALVSFWYKKTITPVLLIACLSILLLVDIIESAVVSRNARFLPMQRERAYYSLLIRSVSYLPAILYLVRSKRVKKVFIR